jgi:pimeloyl-ACP methyl ester carboxylesterase
MHRSGVLDAYAQWYARPGRLSAALAQYRAIYEDADHNRRGLGALLDMPTLALSGPGDVALSGDGLRRIARHVRQVAITGTGHYAHEEQPDRYAEAVSRFIG